MYGVKPGIMSKEDFLGKGLSPEEYFARLFRTPVYWCLLSMLCLVSVISAPCVVDVARSITQASNRVLRSPVMVLPSAAALAALLHVAPLLGVPLLLLLALGAAATAFRAIWRLGKPPPESAGTE